MGLGLSKRHLKSQQNDAWAELQSENEGKGVQKQRGACAWIIRAGRGRHLWVSSTRVGALMDVCVGLLFLPLLSGVRKEGQSRRDA